MQPILIAGIIIFTGFICGEIFTRFRLPKVTGYIIAGILLNPELFHLIPVDSISNTNLITNISLSFITFSVGGTLLYSKVRELGKKIILITLFEAEFAFLAVFIVFMLLAPFFIHQSAEMIAWIIPLALLAASLASPTDPSATLAVEHEYHAQGEVTSTIMGVAAFDDILGIINYSVAVAVASVFVLNQSFGFNSIIQPFLVILGSLLLGAVFGLILNLITRFIRKETDGVLIVVIFGLLSLCYGTAASLKVDELLATMTMGVIAVNFNEKRERLFVILERYTEELIFVLFFTLSAMHLNFSVMLSNLGLIILFVVGRIIGKYVGTLLGAKISKSSENVRKYAAGGLVPQGGIVIGLALLIHQNPAFRDISGILLNVIIGATIFHELIGPVASKFALRKAGEIT